MKIEWLVIAEAGAEDSRGVVSLIGVNQNVTTAPELPTSIKRTVCLYAVDEDGEIVPGDNLGVRLTHLDPDGDVLQAASSDIKLGDKRWAELPGSIQLVADMIFVAHKYGAYSLVCEITHDKTGRVEGSIPFYVLPPSES